MYSYLVAAILYFWTASFLFSSRTLPHTKMDVGTSLIFKGDHAHDMHGSTVNPIPPLRSALGGQKWWSNIYKPICKCLLTQYFVKVLISQGVMLQNPVLVCSSVVWSFCQSKRSEEPPHPNSQIKHFISLILNNIIIISSFWVWFVLKGEHLLLNCFCCNIQLSLKFFSLWLLSVAGKILPTTQPPFFKIYPFIKPINVWL